MFLLESVIKRNSEEFVILDGDQNSNIVGFQKSLRENPWFDRIGSCMLKLVITYKNFSRCSCLTM